MMIATLFALLAIITAPYAPVSYSCNGVTAAFAVTFPYQDLSHVVAISTTGAGVATTLSYTTDYTLSVVSTLGTATLTLTNPAVKCPTGSTLKISRVVPLTQPTNFAAQLSFRPELHTAVADLLEMQIQQVNALSPPSLLTTKGDLLGRNANSPVRVPLGTTSQVLMADPTSAAGLSWVAPTVPAETSQPGLGSKSPFINVRAAPYFADNTGATDAATAINSALTDGAGREVRFASGTYAVGAQLSPGADTLISCDGICTIIPFGGFASAVFLVRANRVTISGLTFTGVFSAVDVNGITGFTAQGNRVNSAAGPGLGVISTNSRVRILDNNVDSTVAPNISISLHGNTDVIVRGNIVTNAGDDGIAVRALTGDANETVIASNVIDDVGKAGIKLTVESSSTAGVQNFRASISGNVIRKWGANVAEAAISIDNHLAAGELNQNIVVSSNSIESANRTNEQFYISASNTKDVAIVGNVMRGGTNASGITVQGASYVTISGNIVADACKVSGLTNTGGIQVLLTLYGTITGNVIRNPGKVGNNRPGIYVETSQYLSITGNTSVDDQGTPTMTYGIEMSSNGGGNRNDFNTLIGNVSKGHVTGALTFGAFQQHQIGIGNHDGTSGGITTLTTAANKTSGVRNASTRNILRNASVAPVDCGGAGITATVTQMLDGGIFTCGTAQTLTTARADGTSGMVQALPGIPAVGDVFQFFMSSTAAANFTLAAGFNVTLVGNLVVNNASRVVVCRITAVTLNAETATCYL